MDKRIVTSWDDGTFTDIRLAELLNYYHIPATFFIPSNCSINEEVIEALNKSFNMRIGGHTVTHPERLNLLSPDDQYFEIKENKDWLESILKKQITEFCYPGGKHDAVTIEQVKRAGFESARCVAWNNNKEPEDSFRIMPSAFVHPDDNKFGGISWFDHAIKQLNSKGDYFHLWGHSKDIDQFEMWDDVEAFFKVLKRFL